ncbi:MAG TPA: hypothetical protein VGM14_24335 [Streptosporangiaceae bacterium]
MTSLDAKLQLKPGQTIALVGTGPELEIGAPTAGPDAASTVVAFAKDSGELKSQLTVLQAVAGRGGVPWVAYPKAKQLGTDLTRDVIRDLVPEAGLDPVRQIALDDVWSALRLKAI